MTSDPASLLRSLGDDTRVELYRRLAAATRPQSAAELAEALGCHANTARLHLERLREAGLVCVESVHRGTVGRPQHVYALAPDAPAVTFDPPAHALLAGLLAALAERMGADAEDAAGAGRAWGAGAVGRARGGRCVAVLTDQLDALGFEPTVAADSARSGSVDVTFTSCPFRELAEAYPELVCHLHRGICEGVVETAGGGKVDGFNTLYDPTPCRVTVSIR